VRANEGPGLNPLAKLAIGQTPFPDHQVEGHKRLMGQRVSCAMSLCQPFTAEAFPILQDGQKPVLVGEHPIVKVVVLLPWRRNSRPTGATYRVQDIINPRHTHVGAVQLLLHYDLIMVVSPLDGGYPSMAFAALVIP
jgi:hypothetical protein